MPRTKSVPMKWSPGDQPIVEQKFAMKWFSDWMDIQFESRMYSDTWTSATAKLLVEKLDISLESAILLVEAWLIMKREIEDSS